MGCPPQSLASPWKRQPPHEREPQQDRPGKPFGWAKLPAELRLQILEDLDLLVNQESCAKRSALACVCSEWQIFFEAFSFRTLQLSSAEDIKSFRRIVRNGRERYVKSVWLHVSLKKHWDFGLPCIGRPERRWRVKEDNRRFTKLLFGLLDILSKWKCASSNHQSAGLQLKLSAGCCGEFMRVAEYNDKYYARPPPGERFMRSIEKQGKCSVKASGYRWYRINTEGNRLGFDLKGGRLQIPEVPVIRWFSIENDSAKYPDASATKTILEKFTRLEGVTYAVQTFRSFLGGESAHVAFFASLPRGVRTISFSELQEFSHYAPNITAPSMAVAVSALEASRQAESFAVSYIVDAELFFEPYYEARFSHISEPKPWANLRYLALTSFAFEKIGSENTEERANKLLIAAANAATLMPKLQVMELWNARNQLDTRKLGELIFVFCFEITGDLATIVVEVNWPFNLSEDASNAWEQLAMRRTQRRPVIKRKSPCYVEVRLNARARVIKHLKLSKHIIQQAPFV
ncbi:hypothetical protein CPLU01_14057 [Colletotrichum plurivorum]|uniref:DUF6546 domain-containing protein n=1 Tax=Colletotrichum plurivorum TaxID=2175906 RepID=A0A8H6N1A1_9PEZI|nr:hypothetical protein CPLU01_14057 [Colletotrichum plurivorum]